MMKCLLYFLCLIISCNSYCQKRISQTYSVDNISELFIDSNEVFKINISAIETDVITLHTIIDGETFASTLLNTTTEDTILKVTTAKTPDYIPFNDKLSAHKVLAIELEITIPIGLDLSVYSTLSSLQTDGELGQVHIDLGIGNFIGKKFRFRESAAINTISGNVNIDLDNAHITAQSRNGKVVIPKEFETGMPLNIESIHGDITVCKSQ